jgi:phosphoribosylamine--glycine ligase
MEAEGRAFKGCLYFGLMITKDGPKVIEYNCRFGDPETQVVLPLLKTDLLTVMQAVSAGKLADIDVEFMNGAAACVIIASGGYPVSYEKGKLIDMGNSGEIENVFVYHAGTALKDGKLVTSGGRVLGVTAIDENLEAAVKRAYLGAYEISFDEAFMRHDIGRRALNALK